LAELRPYQIEAVEAVAKQFRMGHRSVLLVMGTGSGKSWVIAEMCKRSKGRVLVLCHQKEILAQNQAAFHSLTGEQSSIFCAGMGEKCLSHRVVFAHRDSLARETQAGTFSVCIVDESHLVSMRPGSRYQDIFQMIGNPHLVGLTATPHRLQGGKIYGKKKPFEVLAYSMGIRRLIESGYLSPYRFVDVDPLILGSTLDVAGNDYSQAQVDGLVSAEPMVQATVKTILEHTRERRLTLVFCCSRAHAKAIGDLLPRCAYIDGTTKDRDQIVLDIKAGVYRYVVNVGVLTTGVDIPMIDCVAMTRPTMSASLWQQMIGRGLRLHPSKTDLLILEMTDNLAMFGDLNNPMTYGTETEQELILALNGECPVKECPSCGNDVPSPTKVCPHCDHLFLRKREECSPDDILDLEVKSFTTSRVITKRGDPAIKVAFQTNMGQICEWLNIENPNKTVQMIARSKERTLRKEKVIRIRVSKLTEAYPRVLSYHTE